jgi:hypothetical protein
MMKTALNWISWLIVPIALPGWLLEHTYRKISKRFWEFNIWSGTVYILCLVGFALFMLFSSMFLAQILGIYIFSALEMLGIFTCATIPLGNVGGYKSIIGQLARRSPKPQVRTKSTGMGAIWIAITSYLYTAFYFAILGYFMYTLDNALYVGVQGQSHFEILFDFIYFSYVSISTFGFTAISPAAIPSKLSYMAEVTIGLFFMLFIFSLIANHLMSRGTGEAA